MERFAAAWAAPDPDGFAQLMHQHGRLEQPLAPTLVGREQVRDACVQLQRLLPDLRGDLVDWDGDERHVVIRMDLSGTYAGRRTTWRAVDHIDIEDGMIMRRRSEFAAAPLVRALLKRPQGWPRAVSCFLATWRIARRAAS